MLSSAAVIVACFALLWARQRATRNATSVDAWWAAGIALHTAFLAARAVGDPVRRGVIAALVAVWAARLAGHLVFDRVLGGKPEDGRYANLRRKWGQGAFFALYMAQAALVILLPVTFLGAFRNARPFPSPLDAAALGLWLLSIGGEYAADRRLARFRSDPANKGKTCRAGLWKYSRHPNYFFEWLLWCSYIPLSIGSPLFWPALLGPALLLFMLLKVSGIPPTEEQSLSSRGDDYRDYQRTTSAFVPWFPK